VSVAAVCFGVPGALLLFAPRESMDALAWTAEAPLVQVLGGALLGFAVMNWTARGSLLGGIYGRAIVSANQMHTTVGALVLLKHGFAAGGSVLFWVLTAVYVLAALLFLQLLFRGGPR
jgi:hypothetical protein